MNKQVTRGHSQQVNHMDQTQGLECTQWFKDDEKTKYRVCARD